MISYGGVALPQPTAAWPEGAVVGTKTVPAALLDQQISEKDFDALLRIARNPRAASGRLNRIPRKVPLRPGGKR